MKSNTTLLLLGISLFITADAAPTVSRSGPLPMFNRANTFKNVVSAISENGKIQSDKFGKTLRSSLFSAVSKKNVEVQSNEDFFNLFDELLKFGIKTADPDDDLAEDFFGILDGMLSAFAKRGDGQYPDAQWVVSHFNQGTAFGDNTAIVEAFMSLSDEAKVEVLPIVPIIVSSLTSGILNRLESGVINNLIDG